MIMKNYSRSRTGCLNSDNKPGASAAGQTFQVLAADLAARSARWRITCAWCSSSREPRMMHLTAILAEVEQARREEEAQSSGGRKGAQ
jgi:hypothetical protein